MKIIKYTSTVALPLLVNIEVKAKQLFIGTNYHPDNDKNFKNGKVMLNS